jgi:tetratricopeptide (TPR) repeat protein
MMIVRASVWIWRRSPLDKEKKQPWSACGTVAALVLLSLTVVTIVRNRDWRNETTLWTDVMSKDPTNPRPYMSLGLEHLIEGDYATAEKFFDQAIRLNPTSSHAFILRGYLSYRRGKNEQALADYSAALKFDPRDPYAFFYRGELYRKIGESDEALSDYHAALRFMPYYTDAYLGIAMAYLDKDEIAKATTACAKLVEIDAEDRRGYDCLGTLLLEQNRISDALRIYKQGVERNPVDGELWKGLGTAYAKLGMHEEARSAFAKAEAPVANSQRQSSMDAPLLH